MKNCDKLYINGGWVSSASSKFIDVVNATTEEVMGRVPEGTEADANAAIAAARAAFDSWSETPGAKRAEFLLAIQAKLKERTDELAKTITAEVGVVVAARPSVIAWTAIAPARVNGDSSGRGEGLSVVVRSVVAQDEVSEPLS